MKRYLVPLLVLAVLLLAGSSLWLRSPPVPATNVGSQAESTDTQSESSGEPEAAPDTSTDPDDNGTTPDIAPTSPETGSVKPPSADPVPAGDPISTPSDLSSPPPDSQPASTQTPTPTPPPPAKAEQAPAAPAEPEPAPESQPADSTANLSAMAQDLLNEMNRERSAAGIASLTLDPDLSSVAGLRAEEGTTHFSHTRPNGSPYYSAVDDAGLSYRHLGENLATGHTSAQAVIHDWNNSDGHHDNIVSENFTKVGIGLARNNGNPYEGYTWVAVFSG